MEHNTISVVIGSWGSYNACNERALGSKWLNLNDYSDWEEIEEELTKQGFKLNGIDEELFIQDIENFPDRHTNWDYVHPKPFFELLKLSGVLDDEYKNAHPVDKQRGDALPPLSYFIDFLDNFIE